MSIGERITELRKMQNLSQGQLASAIGISRQAVSKWENDQSAPDALNLIRLADILDADIEYLTSGRRSYGRRPPVVLQSLQTVEKIVEKPVIQVVEKTVDRPVVQYVEKPVIEYVEKPVLKRIERVRYLRNPIEFLIIGIFCFLIGLILGCFL